MLSRIRDMSSNPKKNVNQGTKGNFENTNLINTLDLPTQSTKRSDNESWLKHGSLDNESIFSHVLSQSSSIRKLLLPRSSLAHGYKFETMQAAIPRILIIEAYTILTKGRIIPQCIHELFYPPLHQDRCMSVVDSEDWISRLWPSMIMSSTLGRITGFTNAWQQAKDQGLIITEEPASTRDLSEPVPLPANVTPITIANWVTLLLTGYQNNSLILSNMRRETAKIMVPGIVAFAKRGTLTELYEDRVNNMISSELGCPFRLPTNAEMKDIYQSIESLLTKQDAADIIKRWKKYTVQENFSLRTRLIIERAVYSGITSYRIILECLRQYPDFNWARLQGIIGGEIIKFHESYKKIKEGDYTGYDRSEMEFAKRTRFPILSWLCMQILHAADPLNYGSLRDFPTFKGINIPAKDKMLEIISKFKIDREETCMTENKPLSESFQALLEEIKQN